MSRGGKWAIGVAIGLVLLFLIGSCENNDSNDSGSSGPQQTEAQSPTTTETDPTVELISQAQSAESSRDYDEAITFYERAGKKSEATRVGKIAAKTAVRRARVAYNAGRYKAAKSRAAQAVRQYGSKAKGASRVRNQSQMQIKAAAARRRAAAQVRRVAAAQRREQRRIQREQATADAAAADQSGDSAASAEDYSGLNCTEIGHSFTVEPGSDPDHDADNDGVACESE